MTNSQRALELISNGQVLGLGSGRAATQFLHALAAQVRTGLQIRGVATSQATAQTASELGIPLTTLAEVEQLDLAIDGADEVDPNLNLIKGYGGALVRERIVAAASRKVVILVGSEKLVRQLGERGRLPIEVLPFATEFVCRRVLQMGYPSTLRYSENVPFVSDNGNHILDLAVPCLAHPFQDRQSLHDIPGVVDTGLFLQTADLVLIQDGDEVREFAEVVAGVPALAGADSKPPKGGTPTRAVDA